MIPASDSTVVAILFDIDGTLINSGGAGAVSWRRAFEDLYGIPADIGTSVATRRIKTGDRLRVDGGAGRVEILAGEPAASAESAAPAVEAIGR